MRRALWLLAFPWLLPTCLADLPPPTTDPCAQLADAPMPACEATPRTTMASGCNPLSDEALACYAQSAVGCDCPCAPPADETACPPGAAGAVPGIACIPSTPTLQPECTLCRQASCSAACDGVGVVIGNSGKLKSGYIGPMMARVDGADLPGAAKFGVYVRLRGRGTASFILKVSGSDKLRYTHALLGGDAFEDLVLWDEPDGGSAAGAPLRWTNPTDTPTAIDILVGPDDASPMLAEIDCFVPFVLAN
ncbi:MAG: hypothetical protein U0359_09540 [Byssovorax sp.]